jgi:UDP-N-acetyl-alpha-D-muramoyl-L-alanyl-L-glutamate epimerase
MQTFNRFIFDSYGFDPETRQILLTYILEGEEGQVVFNERILFHANTTLDIQGIAGNEVFDRLLCALHIIGGISYYKTCLPKTIEMRSASLSPSQAKFWNEVYENGLGEFFVKNKIDYRGLIQFPSNDQSHESPVTSHEKQSAQDSKLKTQDSRVLVPIGGGKDSLVTAELVKASGLRASLFRMGHHPLIETMANEVHLPLITVERHLDGQLFDLNAQGALNGHIPITAYLSFLTIIVARLTGHTAVAISSERSASEGNLEHFGMQVNHQWSKSLEFERALQDYLTRFVGTDIRYFSALRPLSELHITKLLTEHPQYLELFTSCNTNWKILKNNSRVKAPGAHATRKAEGGATWPPADDKNGNTGGFTWCGKCPKCAFAFALMAAFAPKDELTKIFGKNLFADASLLPLYKELLGLEGHKPFECVGTPEETEAALQLAHERGDLDGTPVMDLYLKDVHPKRKDSKSLVEGLMTPVADHAIPTEFQRLIPNS